MGLFRYRSVEAALEIGVMIGIVALLALSLAAGYELVRQRRAGGGSTEHSRLRFIGPFAAFIGPQLLGYAAATSYFGDGQPIVRSVILATIAMLVGMAVMLPLMWWLVPRLGPRLR